MSGWGPILPGSVILDQPPTPPAIWGHGKRVLWAEGESLLIAGPTGLGKSTLAQQLALGRCGFPEYGEVLGFPVAPGGTRVLVLAMDRPKQIQRSMRRMVGEAWRDDLDQRLRIIPGPPPLSFDADPAQLVRICREAGADTVVIDSIKDTVAGVSDDAVGSLYNRARQFAIAEGVQVVELHHTRKQSNQGPRRRSPSLDDVYGATWGTAGAGSVLMLDGVNGAATLDLHHVKQPAEVVGPLRVRLDRDAGQFVLDETADDRVSRIVAKLDELEVPDDTGRPTCLKALTEARFDVGAKSNLEAAIKIRRARESCPNASGQPDGEPLPETDPGSHRAGGESNV